jgi:hypothetical protein
MHHIRKDVDGSVTWATPFGFDDATFYSYLFEDAMLGVFVIIDMATSRMHGCWVPGLGKQPMEAAGKRLDNSTHIVIVIACAGLYLMWQLPYMVCQKNAP